MARPRRLSITWRSPTSSPSLVDLLDIALHRAGEEGVGEPLASDGQRRIPGGGEERVAAARPRKRPKCPCPASSQASATTAVSASVSQNFGHPLAGPAVVADSGDGGERLWFEVMMFHEPMWIMK